MNILQICLPHLSDVATLPWEIQKKSFSTLFFIYFRLFTLCQKKTNTNCCTAALDVYLLLLNASYYLHSPSTASGARYRSACWYWRVEACVSGCCDMGWISAQRGVLCHWSVSKKTGNMYKRRRWSLWTLAVTLLAWHSSCHTSQPLFRATDDNPQLALFRASNVWKNAINLQSDEKSFAVQKLVWWHFQVWWASGLQFVFFWDNINNQKYVWILLLKYLFWISQGKVPTSDRWGGQTWDFMWNFLRI